MLTWQAVHEISIRCTSPFERVALQKVHDWFQGVSAVIHSRGTLFRLVPLGDLQYSVPDNPGAWSPVTFPVQFGLLIMLDNTCLVTQKPTTEDAKHQTSSCLFTDEHIVGKLNANGSREWDGQGGDCIDDTKGLPASQS